MVGDGALARMWKLRDNKHHIMRQFFVGFLGQSQKEAYTQHGEILHGYFVLQFVILFPLFH